MTSCCRASLNPSHAIAATPSNGAQRAPRRQSLHFVPVMCARVRRTSAFARLSLSARTADGASHDAPRTASAAALRPVAAMPRFHCRPPSMLADARFARASPRFMDGSGGTAVG